jgi:hypothetical protein
MLKKKKKSSRFEMPRISQDLKQVQQLPVVDYENGEQL